MAPEKSGLSAPHAHLEFTYVSGSNWTVCSLEQVLQVLVVSMPHRKVMFFEPQNVQMLSSERHAKNEK